MLRNLAASLALAVLLIAGGGRTAAADWPSVTTNCYSLPWGMVMCCDFYLGTPIDCWVEDY